MATVADSPVFSPHHYSSNKRGVFRENRFSHAPIRGSGRGGYRGGQKNYNQRNTNTFNDSCDLEELKAILVSNFNKENLAIDNFEKEITSKWTKTRECVDAIVIPNPVSIVEELANSNKRNTLNFSSSSEFELKKELIRLRSTCELNEVKHCEDLETLRAEYDLQLFELRSSMELAVSKSLKIGLENKNLKAALKSLETTHQKYKADFDARLEEGKIEVEKKFNVRLNSVNLLLKVEQEKFEKAEGNVKKTIEDKVKAATAVYRAEKEVLESEKKEIENLLSAQLDENANLSEALSIIHNEMGTQKIQLVQLLQETVKDCCECSICLCIYDKAVTTTCGHTFCKACIDDWEQHSVQGQCPVCRQKCTHRNILFFDDLLASLKENFPSVKWTKDDIPSSSSSVSTINF